MQGYEPFVISARKNVPWYDVRFRGEGQDRIVHTLNMAGSVNFAVHPTAFVVRQPRPAGQSAQLAKSLPQYTEVSLQTHSLQQSHCITAQLLCETHGTVKFDLHKFAESLLQVTEVSLTTLLDELTESKVVLLQRYGTLKCLLLSFSMPLQKVLHHN